MQQKTEKKFFHVDISASDLAALNSQLRRKYFWPAVNEVLRFCLSLRETFSKLIVFTVINKYGKSGFIQISALFSIIYLLLVEGSSETRLFRHLSNNVLRNP